MRSVERWEADNDTGNAREAPAPAGHPLDDPVPAGDEDDDVDDDEYDDEMDEPNRNSPGTRRHVPGDRCQATGVRRELGTAWDAFNEFYFNSSSINSISFYFNRVGYTSVPIGLVCSYRLHLGSFPNSKSDAIPESEGLV